MRFIFPLLLAVALGIASPARAQIFQITASGDITQTSGIYSSVPTGSPFTFAETFNTANATLVSSTGTSAIYEDSTGAWSSSFDGFNFSGTATEIQIDSNDSGSYGFIIGGMQTNGTIFGLQLLGNDSVVAPTTALNSLQTFPISDFGAIPASFGKVLNSDGDFAAGPPSSFSVQSESVPEPSTVALFVFGIPLLWWLRRRNVTA